ncbi:hypothetical protein [Streptomyces purpurogeneiscleroticus]|uniref:hypothetical protein n=1 Tax=Streptomyces purpurogeneiscleroticus TaxID=68259 RepID=UPI001CBF033C|nr:hypothetical protein [Streptomyces purpurogeneiscleroticus]
MTDEPRVDQCDPPACRDLGQQPGRLGGVGRAADIEAQLAQVAFERRPGDRRTGEDCGRQTNSLPECWQGRRPVRIRYELPGQQSWHTSGPARVGGTSAEVIGSPDAAVHHAFTGR